MTKESLKKKIKKFLICVPLVTWPTCYADTDGLPEPLHKYSALSNSIKQNAFNIIYRHLVPLLAKCSLTMKNLVLPEVTPENVHLYYITVINLESFSIKLYIGSVNTLNNFGLINFWNYFCIHLVRKIKFKFVIKRVN